MRHRSEIARGVFGFLVVLGLWPGTEIFAETTYYHVTDLGTLGGPGGLPRAVNNHGEVVGHLASESDPDTADRAFLWLPQPAYGLPAGMNVLPPLVEGGAAWATDINDAGLIVGGAETGATAGSGYKIHHAVVWEDGVVTDLGAPDGAEVSSSASAVNETGEVAGGWFGDPGAANWIDQWFLWLPTAAYGLPAGMNDLGVPGGVRRMNESGEIVGGKYWADTQTVEGKVWLPAAAHGLPAGESTLLDFAIIEDINDSGVMVGYAEPHRALRWSNGTVTDIGTLGGDYAFARAINSDGAIVGSASRGMGYYHTYVWQDAVMTDVNDLLVPGPGYEITDPWDINDVGQILSDARLYGEWHHVLLTRFTCGNGVVEPGEGCDDGNTEQNDLCNQFCQGPGIPAVSSWGVACAALSLLIAGTVILRRRPAGAGAPRRLRGWRAGGR